ncbi:HxlR family transcriptional regulator [Paraburkholderia sp. BL6669N2]|uniref:winged helix-turn-helix transcriptional regulator n=1 Tax=Paraburkholderia sp. BL6669N2 TaxID=1938807 RepID=UPI000E23E972|nr:helix-turn-helix domain-containing protein [Paraburkholderia sp. BL6669N2]REG49622.1 HxlR family transcriptional regulator [Paraburkholderia sp. BL6669N2]
MENRSPSCGLDVALSVVGGKWKPIFVLLHLNGGPRRFGELRRLVVGISEKVLIQQVRELAEDGIIVRCDYREVPPRVDYQMTEFGRTLAQALMPLCTWGNENRHRIENWSHTEMAKSTLKSDEAPFATAG